MDMKRIGIAVFLEAERAAKQGLDQFGKTIHPYEGVGKLLTEEERKWFIENSSNHCGDFYYKGNELYLNTLPSDEEIVRVIRRKITEDEVKRQEKKAELHKQLREVLEAPLEAWVDHCGTRPFLKELPKHSSNMKDIAGNAVIKERKEEARNLVRTLTSKWEEEKAEENRVQEEEKAAIEQEERNRRTRIFTPNIQRATKASRGASSTSRKKQKKK